MYTIQIERIKNQRAKLEKGRLDHDDVRGNIFVCVASGLVCGESAPAPALCLGVCDE